MNENYEEKYKKYKLKYMNMIKQRGGAKLNYNNAFLYYFNTPLRDQILLRFGNLNDLTRVDVPLENYGGTGSANGFVRKLTFNEENNQYSTIAKISMRASADNSYFEFVNGKCINKLKEYYPNFVYTFNYGKIDDTFKKNIKDTPDKITKDSITNEKNFKIMVETNDCNLMKLDKIREGCDNNNNAIFMIEYLPNSYILKHFFENYYKGLPEQKEFRANFNYNIFCILFQIYALLSGTRNYFTHYDLHAGNIMISILNNPIIIEYNDNGKIYKLKTKYIPYIIDYGRSYINCLKLDSLLFSRSFLETACEVRECGRVSSQKCNGVNSGLWIERENLYEYKHAGFGINPRARNMSHDLRLFFLIFEDSFIIRDFDKTDIYTYFNQYRSIYIGHDDRLDLLENSSVNIPKNRGDIIPNVYVLSEMLKIYHEKSKYNNIATDTDIDGTLKINMDFEEREKWSFTHK